MPLGQLLGGRNPPLSLGSPSIVANLLAKTPLRRAFRVTWTKPTPWNRFFSVIPLDGRRIRNQDKLDNLRRPGSFVYCRGSTLFGSRGTIHLTFSKFWFLMAAQLRVGCRLGKGAGSQTTRQLTCDGSCMPPRPTGGLGDILSSGANVFARRDSLPGTPGATARPGRISIGFQEDQDADVQLT